MIASPTIHRAIHDTDHPYTPTRRATAQDTRLSYESAGLLWLLLSKPTDWKIIPEALVRDDCNLRKVMRLFGELIDAGYMSRNAVRNDLGRITGWKYEVFEEPQPVTKKSTHGQSQPMDNPADGFFAPLQNKEIKDSTEIQQKTTTNTGSDSQESTTGAAFGSVVVFELTASDLWESAVHGELAQEQHQPQEARAVLPSKPETVEYDAFGLPIPPVPRAPLSAPQDDKPLVEQDNPMGRVLRLLESGDGWGKPVGENDCKNASLALDEYGESWVIHAIKEAAFKGRKFWGFANSCLANWQQTGRVNINYDRQKTTDTPAPDYSVSPGYLALSNLIGEAADRWWSEQQHGQTQRSTAG